MNRRSANRLSLFVLIASLLCSFALRLEAQPAEAAEAAALHEKLRRECEKFPLLPLKYDASGQAEIQFIDASKSFYMSDGYRYFGFRFKAPATITGDFSWMYLLRNQYERITLTRIDWNIVPRKEGSKGFDYFERRNTAKYPKIAAQFPNTRDLTIQYQNESYFLPNEEYIIFFRIPDIDKAPEMALAFAFTEKDQKAPDAKLPLGSIKTPAKPKPLTSYEGDPW